MVKSNVLFLRLKTKENKLMEVKNIHMSIHYDVTFWTYLTKITENSRFPALFNHISCQKALSTFQKDNGNFILV